MAKEILNLRPVGIKSNIILVQARDIRTWDDWSGADQTTIADVCKWVIEAGMEAAEAQGNPFTVDQYIRGLKQKGLEIKMICLRPELTPEECDGIYDLSPEEIFINTEKVRVH